MIQLIIWTLAHLIGPVTCHGTRFGDPGDKLGSEPALALGRRVRPGDMGIAHRRLPMGTRVLVCAHTRPLCALGRVLDRGPYGATDESGQWYNNAPRYREDLRGKRLRYRGCVDLMPSMADAIGLTGRERVLVRSF